MKRALLTHPKTNDLASRLECSRPEAIGYLAMLFDFCAEHSPQGDLGKWPNGAIARACDWDGPPDALISALIGSKWVDEHQKYRLLIHDWSANCDNWVRAKVKKLGLSFCSYDGSYEPTEEPTEDALTVSRGALTVSKGKGKGKEGKEKKPRARFQKPTIEEVTAYCRERGKGTDPVAWLDHYKANGWMVGKTKMQDWKAAVRNWENNDFSGGKHGKSKERDQSSAVYDEQQQFKPL